MENTILVSPLSALSGIEKANTLGKPADDMMNGCRLVMAVDSHMPGWKSRYKFKVV